MKAARFIAGWLVAIDVFFGRPLQLRAGEGLRRFRRRIQEAITVLEEHHDPVEAAAGKVAASAMRTRLAQENIRKLLP